MGNEIIDAIGNTPATIAAASGDWEKVKKLLEVGADVRCCNCFGQNAQRFVRKKRIYTDAHG